jgi:hypothetical protein
MIFLTVILIRSSMFWAGVALCLFIGAFVFEAGILWNVLLLSLLWMAITWLLSKLIRAMAFLLDRALSQEKGVLAGAAVLCLVITAAIKLL